MIAKLKRLINGIEQAAALGARCQALEESKTDLERKNSALWESYNKKHEEAMALSKKLADITAKVREQTEADLLLTSLKIIQGAMRGEKVVEMSGLSAMQAQQLAAMQATVPNYGGYAGFGGVLGTMGRIYP